MVPHSCAGAANKGIMATVVHGGIDELIYMPPTMESLDFQSVIVQVIASD